MPEPSRPSEPFQPASLNVYGVYPRTRPVLVRDGKTGERRSKTERVFDARYVVDGREYRYGFKQRGWADDFVRSLQEGHAKGWLFDPTARRFVAPEPEPRGASEDEGPSFFAHAVECVARKWPAWEPASRRNAQRDIARACLYLLRIEAPELSPADRAAADEFLRRAALMVPAERDGVDTSWGAWFGAWSRPLRQIDDEDLQGFLEDVRTRAADGTARPLADSSLRRTRAVVRGVFSSAQRRRLIDWDPWTAVETEPTRDHEQVDPDLVMDLRQVFELAKVCGQRVRGAEPFVLTQGLCAPRPGEAVELRRRDVDLVDGHLTVRGTHSEVPSRFFAEGESRQRPMKGRGARARRRVPLPTVLVEILREHLAGEVGEGPDALLFTTPSGAQLNLSNFHRDVWQDARTAVFPAGSPLRAIRRHDLRHSAITAWLNAGVPLKTVQSWSGHKTASVVLDTYLGVLRGDEALGRTRFEAALNAAVGSDPVTGS